MSCQCHVMKALGSLARTETILCLGSSTCFMKSWSRKLQMGYLAEPSLSHKLLKVNSQFCDRYALQSSSPAFGCFHRREWLCFSRFIIDFAIQMTTVMQIVRLHPLLNEFSTKVLYMRAREWQFFQNESRLGCNAHWTSLTIVHMFNAKFLNAPSSLKTCKCRRWAISYKTSLKETYSFISFRSFGSRTCKVWRFHWIYKNAAFTGIWSCFSVFAAQCWGLEELWWSNQKAYSILLFQNTPPN